MSRQIHVARDEMEIGVLSEQETRDLLQAGFLKPSDVFWTAGMADWKPLSRFEPEMASLPPLTPDQLRRAVAAAANSIAAHAGAVGRKLRSLAQAKGVSVDAASRRLLEDYVPRIRQELAKQLAQGAVQARTALEDEAALRKVFGAIYDCLPKPVCRFVSEQQFIEFCVERKRLLAGERTRGDTQEHKDG